MISDYVTVGGCELFNVSRAAALTSRADDCTSDEDYAGPPTIICDDCDGLAAWLTEQCGGDLADVTLAPWYDPARPETADIRGIFALGITGAGAGVMGSASADSASPSGLRREVEIEFAIITASELATSAALAWIADRLDLSSCAADCIGVDLCALAGCPTNGNFAGAMRTIPDVRVVDGPVVTQIDTFNARSQIVQGTILVETPNPYILHPAPAAAVLTLTMANSSALTIDLNPECPDPDPCGVDPDFPLPALPDLAEGTTDPAWPTEPFAARGRTWSISGSILQRSAVGLRLDVTTGELPMRNLVVQVWHNPLGIPCSRVTTDVDADCEACALVVVKYLPPRSTTTIDAAKRIREIVCVDGGLGVPQMWGPNANAFTWPILYCGGGVCLRVAAADPFATDALITASFVPMDGAA